MAIPTFPTVPRRASILASLAVLAMTTFAPRPADAQYGPPGPSALPPPSGYVYVPDPQRYAMLHARLQELRIQRSQHRLGGPIVMMSIGGATVISGAYVALVFALARDVGGSSYGAAGFDYTRGMRVAGGVALIGGVLVGTGVHLLRQRVRLRRQFDPEILQIRQELRMFGFSGLDIRARAGGFAAALRFTF